MNFEKIRPQLWKYGRRGRQALSAAVKIGIGSAAAILVCQLLKLPNAASAGTITLLTLIARTRKDTIQLIGWRLVSFVITVVICAVIFPLVEKSYLAYALFLFADVLILDLLNWQSTLSVNAVIGAHFLINRDFSAEFVIDELILLMIGTLIAFGLNLLQPTLSERERLYRKIGAVEAELKTCLCDVSAYLRKEQKADVSRSDLNLLQEELNECIAHATQFTQNSFHERDKWFLQYFEVRLLQCMILKQLHAHVKAIQSIPGHGKLAANFIDTLSFHVTESSRPKTQLEDVDRLIRQGALCPDEQSDFESQAMFYHVLLDLKEYLQLESEFLSSLSPRQLRQYEEKVNYLPKEAVS